MADPFQFPCVAGWGRFVFHPSSAKGMLGPSALAAARIKHARDFSHYWTSFFFPVHHSLFGLVCNEGTLGQSAFAWACSLQLPGVLAVLCKCLLGQNRYVINNESVQSWWRMDTVRSPSVYYSISPLIVDKLSVEKYISWIGVCGLSVHQCMHLLKLCWLPECRLVYLNMKFSISRV